MNIVDSFYSADKTSRHTGVRLSLPAMPSKVDLLQKADPGKMDGDFGYDYDHKLIVAYNCRDADLHVWPAEDTLMYERSVCSPLHLGARCGTRSRTTLASSLSV